MPKSLKTAWWLLSFSFPSSVWEGLFSFLLAVCQESFQSQFCSITENLIVKFKKCVDATRTLAEDLKRKIKEMKGKQGKLATENKNRYPFADNSTALRDLEDLALDVQEKVKIASEAHKLFEEDFKRFLPYRTVSTMNDFAQQQGAYSEFLKVTNFKIH